MILLLKYSKCLRVFRFKPDNFPKTAPPDHSEEAVFLLFFAIFCSPAYPCGTTAANSANTASVFALSA